MTKPNRPTRIIALLLALLTLCLTLTACQSGQEESSEPKLAAEVQQEKAASAASAAAAEKEGADTLRVVTDLDCYFRADGLTSSAEQGKRTFQEMLKYFGGVPSGMDVELEVIPMDAGGAYDAELTHLRTEIMAGGGPDVFLMSGFAQGCGVFPENTLFQSPETAMAKGFFLPLDKYIENAQFMEFDKFDQKVMEAGRNEQGQVIVPMFYGLTEGWIFPAAEDEVIPADWNEGIASEDPSIREMMAVRLGNTGFRSMCFDKIADYETEELLLDKEELFQRTMEAVNLQKSQVAAINEMLSMTSVEMIAKATSYNTCLVRTPQGKINAPIETWCAVNNNTKYPENAFFIVDMLLSKEFLSQEAFWNKNIPNPNAMSMTFFWTAGGGEFIPVHTGLVTTAKGRYKYNTTEPSRRRVLRDARENIDYAWFTNSLDRELNSMFWEMAERLLNGEDVTEAEVRKATDQCYTTLKMMLMES